MTTPRVFFYVQHLLGIGHLARANRIARALLDSGFEVTLAVGGPPVAAFMPTGAQIVQLPVVKAGQAGFSSLEDDLGRPVTEAYKEWRRQRLLDAFASCNPDILIVEAFPFGRRAMRFELLPLLDLATRMPHRPLIATSVRDILQKTSKPGRAEETLALVERYFDLVLVHGDPAFARLEETFPLAARMTREICYTGLVAGPVPAEPAESFDIVVSAGGGAAGFAIVSAALGMVAQPGFAARSCVITGPNLPQREELLKRARSIPRVSVFDFRPDFPSLLRGARLSISQSGYNTVCDILRAGCRALLVPFAEGGETEQGDRAARLKALGLARSVPEAGITPDRLRAEADDLLRAPPPQVGQLDLEGARRTGDILRQRLADKARG
ncbi:MAG: glycosyltransferase [Hyphomicrobiales bacterium]